VKSKRPPRKNPRRRRTTGRKNAAKNSGFNATYALATVSSLLALLLAGALIATILEKPQATEAWSLVREIFPPTVSALLAFVGARYSISKYP
jgi:hypothetical protein